MSTILVNTLTGTSTAGSIAVTGEGGSTTTNLQQGLAKSWLNFNMAGTTASDSFNLSSLTDRATGQFTVNLSSAHDSAGYGCVGNTNAYAGDSFAGGMALGLHANHIFTSTASAYGISSYDGSSYIDAKHNSSATHGDLA